jgi:cap1 methyltransferase
MWEIFYSFNVFKKFNINENFTFAHLAEGPGGFMEATYNYKKLKSSSHNDTFHAITLKPTNDFIPDFSKIKKIFNNNSNINIDYGNLYNIEDVNKYIKNFKSNKAHLVTADGGFDYSSDFNGQEVNSCQIIYSECIVALNVLRKNGSFVCKVFDLFSITMVQILYLVYSCFEEIYIYKPETSRPANSEKYIICMYYKDNLNNDNKKQLLNIIEKWSNIELNQDESVFFKNIKVDNNFIQKLNLYNEKYIESQMFYLNKTIELAKNEITKDSYYEIIHEQVLNAIKWCNKYNVEINKNSIFYKKNIM